MFIWFDVCVTVIFYSDRDVVFSDPPYLCRFSTLAVATSSVSQSPHLVGAANSILGILQRKWLQTSPQCIRLFQTPPHVFLHPQKELPRRLRRLALLLQLPRVPRPHHQDPRVMLSLHPSSRRYVRLCTRSPYCRPPCRSLRRFPRLT